MKLSTKIITLLGVWFIACIFVSTAMIFLANVLLPYHWVFRQFFWCLFIGGSMIFTIFITFIQPWINQYNEAVASGTSEKTAFVISCEKIKFCPPKFVLNWFRKK